MLTVSAPPLAAKPPPSPTTTPVAVPAAFHCTWPAPVPIERMKKPLVSSTARLGLVPPELRVELWLNCRLLNAGRPVGNRVPTESARGSTRSAPPWMRVGPV